MSEPNLSSLTLQSLNIIRQRLLDLSKRNQLLSYKEKVRTIYIVEPPIESLFDKLVLENRSMTLMPQSAEAVDKSEPPKQIITTQLSNERVPISGVIDGDEPIIVKSKKSSEIYLQTWHAEENLEQRGKKLAQETRTAIEETGNNLLYLAMGFLEWYESQQSQMVTRAPLILIPVKIERTYLARATTYNYVLSYLDEEIETNISLAEKLANDFNLKLPEFTEDTAPKQYLQAVAQVVEKMPRWQVTAEVRLDLFSFTKLLMYKDLDDSSWPENARLSDNNNIKQLLEGKEKTVTAPTIEAEKLQLDTNPLTDKTPLVLDADSSQQAVIMEALWNHANLVVEGPPGTGKSQTIANLIAAALSQNKSVLFVAEKKAALEVVRSRLDQVELGEFCLELHSHKGQKSEIHRDLKTRLEKQYLDVERLERDQADLIAQKQQLLAYSQLVETVVGPNQEKIYEVFWAVERLRGDLAGERLRFEVTQPFKISREEFNDKVTKLTDFGAQYQALSHQQVLQHWQGFKPTKMWPGDEEDISHRLSTLLDETTHYQNMLHELITTTQFPLTANPTLDTLQNGSQIDTTLLTNMPTPIDSRIATAFLATDAMAQLKQFQAAQKEYQQLLEQSAKILKQIEQSQLWRQTIAVASEQTSDSMELVVENLEFWQPTAFWEMIQPIADAAAQLHYLGFSNDSPNELAMLITQVDKLDDELQSLLNNPDSMAHFCRFLTLRQLAQQAPDDLILNKHPAHALESTQVLFQYAQPIFAQLTQQWQDFATLFLLRKVPSADEIRTLADEWRKYRDNWLAWFSADYWRVRSALKSFFASAKLSQVGLFEQLEQLATLKEKIEQESEREQYQQLFGPLFKGIETDWAHLSRHLQWAQQLGPALGSASQAEELLATQPDPRNYLLKNTAVIYEQWLRVAKVAEQLNVPVDSQLPVHEFVEKLFERRQLVAKLIAVLQQLPMLTDQHIISLHGALQNLLTAQQLRLEQAENNWLKELLIDQFQGIDSKVDNLITAAQWILQASGHLSTPLLHWLVSEHPNEKNRSYQALLQQNQTVISQLTALSQQLATFGEFTVEQWLQCGEQPGTLAQLIETAKNSQATVNALGGLATFYYLKQTIDAIGLSIITEAVITQQIQPAHAPLHFKYTYYQSMARELMRQHAGLTTFARTNYENLRHRFAQLDRKILRRQRQRIAYQIVQRSVPEGNCSGRVSSYTEKCLVEHELNKKKRHISIRQLVRRATLALQALKPCFMMSPLSVAQYLPPGQIQFDLLIMDEASQVRPEDALGAIARAQQIVIVGDPKQLPPTPFFERLIHEEEEQPLETALDGQESILDLCLSTYRKGRLRWHYRSAHESLIAFSNHHFYDNELIVFPAPVAKNELYGVRRHYVEGANYLTGRNLKEAEAVVTAVVEHFKTSPHLSLGVATFNLKQQELINDLLEKRYKTDNWLEEQTKATEATNEPFFIKNLENVQGDERDVIFVSTTYGPELESRRVFQRFGPIASELGWRRLNVIFTRAKKRLELFTSLHSSDIILSHDAKRGVRILKMYLEYAETGRLPDYGSATGREADSDFEIAVSRILHEYGYQTVPQVGVAGFRIDIGVCHPANSDEYILGIECDGATYHSAKSVRDRDRLRQEILESKGWKIHRIWSTDWFKNREAEIGRLLETLSTLTKKYNELTK
jgi:very-short-patch-repair endonuclease